jgi:ribose 5-phosphate isomerase B
MRIALGADHRGHNAIRLLADKLRREGHDVRLLSGESPQPSDYPDGAFLVGKAVAAGEADLGILICGTGIGMSIAANKIRGIRAAVVHDELTARLARSHNNANIICMSADLLGQRIIENIVDVALRTSFEGGRHARRVDKIGMIESGRDPTTMSE